MKLTPVEAAVVQSLKVIRRLPWPNRIDAVVLLVKLVIESDALGTVALRRRP